MKTRIYVACSKLPPGFTKHSEAKPFVRIKFKWEYQDDEERTLLLWCTGEHEGDHEWRIKGERVTLSELVKAGKVKVVE